MGNGSWCAAPNCHNGRKKCPDLSFFRFPKIEERCKLWVINSGRQDLINKDASYIHKNCVLCANHFEVDQCMNPKKNKLIWNAVPTLFYIPKRSFARRHHKTPLHEGHMLRSKAKILPKHATKVPQKRCISTKSLGKCCLYVYCRNSARYENREFMRGIFFVPVPPAEENLKTRRLWLESCGRFDLSKNRLTDGNSYYVCSTHFEGGNGPTADHPDPIAHRVAQKSSDFDGGRPIRVLNSRHVPPLLPQTDTLADISPSGCDTAEEQSGQATLETDLAAAGEGEKPAVRVLSDQGNLQGKGDTPPHYEITVRELPVTSPPGTYSISDIRANFPVPYDWIMCLTVNSVFFTKISEATNCLLVQFTIKKDMSTQLQALCKELDSSHPLLNTFPKDIRDAKSLDSCFLLLRCWRPCKGNNERAYVNLFSERENIGGFYSPQTDSVHSLKCTLLTNGKTSRCKMCQMQRSSMRSVLRRFMKTHEEFWSVDENDAVEIDEHVYEIFHNSDSSHVNTSVDICSLDVGSPT